jgi:hypothetical protein
VRQPFPHARPVAAAQLHRSTRRQPPLPGPGGDLGQPEHTQRHGHERQAVAEEQAAEGEAVLGGGRRGTDRAQQQPEQARDQALGHVAA